MKRQQQAFIVLTCIIKDADGDIRALVQSLIHTSDPGQYGVNKSDETVDIKKFELTGTMSPTLGNQFI